MMTERGVAAFAEKLAEIADRIRAVFVGKSDVVELLLNGVVSGLHVLIEDVPGVGKTTLAKSLSTCLGLDFCRIQFTPDLLPGDIIGMTVWRAETQEFVFKHGAIMHQFILADEINRASPRTQSSLLEAMQEQSVTIDGHTYRLPEPFVVVATQNPSSFMGAFQLPEGELDRFGIAMRIGYPGADDEEEILRRFQNEVTTPAVDQVLSEGEFTELQRTVRDVTVADPVRRFIVELIERTRRTNHIHLGASPRAGVQLQRAAQGHALLAGRDYVMPEDVLAMAEPVLSHRIILSPEARSAGTKPGEVIGRLVKELRLPVGI